MPEEKSRYYWVDVVKVLGIFLVFYAHVLQKTYRLSTDEIFFQYKLIYAFHMPLFFFLSGFFYKRKRPSRLAEIGGFFQKRIFPVFFFGGISLLIWPLYLYLKFGEIDYAYLLSNMLWYLQGHPNLNATLWFLVCLFVVEIWAVLFMSKTKTILQGIFLSAFFLYFGYALTSVSQLEAYFVFPKNFWYIHESFLAFGFFSLGYTFFQSLKKLVLVQPLIRFVLMLFFIWLTIWSVNLNSPSNEFIVVMKASLHGNFYFFISAFAGVLGTILIASFIPKMRWIEYIGKNTLILLGTNGLFMSFFNSHIIDWLGQFGHHQSTFWVSFDSVWISILTIGLSVPIIELLNKWTPQLVGFPQADGPLLKAFAPLEFRFLRDIFENISQKLGSIKVH